MNLPPVPYELERAELLAEIERLKIEAAVYLEAARVYRRDAERAERSALRARRALGQLMIRGF